MIVSAEYWANSSDRRMLAVDSRWKRGVRMASGDGMVDVLKEISRLETGILKQV